MRRLTRSLEVDTSETEKELDWRADVSIEPAVREMVAAYRADGGR
jgi:nucleoside-diphosphate-sugar epimerase